MELMCLLAVHLLQNRSCLCRHLEQRVNRGEYQQDPTPKWNEMLNSKKQESANQIETKNNKNRNTATPVTTEQTLRKEYKINVKLIKKILIEWKTYITISKEPSQEKSQGRNQKYKIITNKHLYRQHHWIRPADLSRREINRW